MRRGRLKTGTPPRVDGRSMNWDVMAQQPSETALPFCRWRNHSKPQSKVCYIGKTNTHTHQIIEEHKIDFITPTQLALKVQFSEKDKTNLDLCRRTLDQLVKKMLLEVKQYPTDKAVENRYTKLH